MSYSLKGELVPHSKAKPYSYQEILEEDHLSSTGSWKTGALFFESTTNSKEDCVFTTKDKDYIVDDRYLYSIKRLYLDCRDPTEYLFAEEVFGGWEAWDSLCHDKWFKPHLDKMRTQLEIKMRSEAIRAVVQKAGDTDTAGLSAAKFIALKEWDRSKRGRPTKAEVDREKKIAAGIENEVEDDYERMSKY